MTSGPPSAVSFGTHSSAKSPETARKRTSHERAASSSNSSIISEPKGVSIGLPEERAEANSLSSDTSNPRLCSTEMISWPTAPVTPTMPTLSGPLGFISTVGTRGTRGREVALLEGRGGVTAERPRGCAACSVAGETEKARAGAQRKASMATRRRGGEGGGWGREGRGGGWSGGYGRGGGVERRRRGGGGEAEAEAEAEEGWAGEQ
mmetsp:Transcript_48450/g.120076  ORF Transcript_48450/g.120076 Transcript_48450/m.120076 type:complete len:206 (+) Transcript_48450:1136-1753(+)